jgi:hypothetical protein
VVVGGGSASAISGGTRTPRSDHNSQPSKAASSTIAAMAIAGHGRPPSRRSRPERSSCGCACKPGTTLRSRSASAFFKASRM